MSDLTREKAKKCLEEMKKGYMPWSDEVLNAVLDVALSALSENKGEWIPITTRPMTEEEKEEYHGEYDPNEMLMYDCEMPEDGQEVLVSTPWGVSTDTFYHDDGWYFETYCDDGDVVAWQPLPEPYKKGE